MARISFLVAFLAVVALPITSPAQAAVRALLIGVSDYAQETGIADLKGPPNDVALLKRVLTERGVSNVTVLADGVDGALRPTRAAILAAFADVAARSEPGDLVYIHLSGHGTRQRDDSGDETDGLDEVFLPADVTKAEQGTGLIPNALVDDEIGEAVSAIRARGADVFFVLDSCHSGSGLRAASPAVATRFVDPAVLGVDARPAGPSADAPLEESAADLPGGLVAFYAAQSSELAREVDLGSGSGNESDSGWYGLFSAKLAARLEAGTPQSYRQLFQTVLADIKTADVPGAARLQTPLWDGDMIDAAVFGGRGSVGVRRFASEGDTIAAGKIHGLSEGSLLGLVASAADDATALIGYAQVEDVDPTRAFVRPVGGDCVPRQDALCPAIGTLPAAAFAQIIAHPIEEAVRLNHPRDAATGEPLDPQHDAVAALAAAIDALTDTATFVISPEDYDVDVAFDGEALWFGTAAVVGDSPVGASVQTGEPIAPLLERIARTERLSAMLEALAGSGSLLNPNPVAVSAELSTVPIDALAEPGEPVSPVRECRAARGRADPAVPFAPGADLKQCDRLAFAAQGTGSGAYDVNRIHIDAQFCAHAVHERIEDSRAARALGPALILCSDCPGGVSAGAERLFTVVSPVEPAAEPLNLEGLVETCTAPAATRSAARRKAVDFLEELAQRPDTRGAFGGAQIADIWVEEWNWTVLPRREAFARAGRTDETSERRIVR